MKKRIYACGLVLAIFSFSLLCVNSTVSAVTKVKLTIEYVDKYMNTTVAKKTYSITKNKKANVSLKFSNSAYKTKINQKKAYKIGSNKTTKIKVTPKVRKHLLTIQYVNSKTNKVQKTQTAKLVYNKKTNVTQQFSSSHYSTYIYKTKKYTLKANKTEKVKVTPYQYTLVIDPFDTRKAVSWLNGKHGTSDTIYSWSFKGYYGETKKITIPSAYGYTRGQTSYTWKVTSSYKTQVIRFTPNKKTKTFRLLRPDGTVFKSINKTIYWGDSVNFSETEELPDYDSHYWSVYEDFDTYVNWEKNLMNIESVY